MLNLQVGALKRTMTFIVTLLLSFTNTIGTKKTDTSAVCEFRGEIVILLKYFYVRIECGSRRSVY